MATAVQNMNCRDYLDLDPWLEARKSLVGASDAAGILGVGYEGQSEFSVWMEKTGKATNELEGEWLECGQALQGAILSLASKRIGLPVEPAGDFTIYHHPSLACMGATLDGKTIHDELGFVPVEAKNVSGFLAKDWEDDEPPLKFNIQVQHQMACTGADMAYVVGLIGGNRVRVKPVRRNQAFIDVLQERIEQFWDYVVRDVPPPVDDSLATSHALAKLYGKENGDTIELPEESAEWAAELEQAKEKIKELVKIKTLNENRIKAAIGKATVGILPNGRWCQWRVEPRRAHDVKSSEPRVLRILK